MEAAVYFFHVDFDVDYSLAQVRSPEDIDQVEKMEHGVVKCDARELALPDSLVDGLAFFPVE